MTGLIVYVALLLTVRTLRRLLDRGRAFRLMIRVLRPDATHDLRVAIEQAGLRAVILPSSGFAGWAFLYSLPTIAWGLIAFFIQVWLRPWPLVTAAVLASFFSLNAALSHIAFRARGYESVGRERSGREWGLLVPAVVIRIGVATIGFVAAYLGISELNAAGIWPGVGWMLFSIVLLGLAHLPVVLADRLARRLRRIDFATTTSTDSTLMLRSFADDQLSLVSGLIDIGPAAPQMVLGRTRFEELIAQALFDAGPLIAIGRPGESLPELGAARTYWADDDWQLAVEATAHRAENVVMIAGLSQGLKWEIDKLRSWGMLRKLLVLLPPDKSKRTAQRILRVIDDLGVESFPQEAALAPMIIGFAFTKDETPVVYVADGPTWEAYVAAVMLHRAFWAKGNEPPPTVEELQRAHTDVQVAPEAPVDGDETRVNLLNRSEAFARARVDDSEVHPSVGGVQTEPSPSQCPSDGAHKAAEVATTREGPVPGSRVPRQLVFAESSQESRYSMEAVELFDLGRREAQRLGQSTFARPHLLLALTSRHPDLISGILGRPAEEVRRAQLEHMDLGWELVPFVQGTSAQFKLFLEYLPTVADELGLLEIEPICILLAMLGDASGPVVRDALGSLGVEESSAWVRARLLLTRTANHPSQGVER
jgi:hypothetical protein